MRFAGSLSYLILITIVFFRCSSPEQPRLFKLLSANETGIDFSNTIIEDDSTNILDYEYVYNGGGVAIADFNNDSLEDVYFTANMSGNKLYLNKKKFSFQDITKESGTTGENKWCTGVSVIDINNDGWKDMYVCAARYNDPERRKNLLYINKGLNKNGVPVFKDEAEAYGLADTSFSTQAAFFDYDNDGDLDMYLLVSGKMDNGFQPNTYAKKITDGSSVTTDKLFRNDANPSLSHPYFTNVSREAGILIEGFGLGVNITDINLDGWKDIYVSNDYLSNDLLWINNKNGTFTNKAASYFKHTSFSAMGNDVQDINNDGLMDVFTLDMLSKDNFRKKMMSPPGNYANYNNNDFFGYDFQYVRNTLQLNQGRMSDTSDPVFSEISLLSGVAETDWSWCPLIADFDNDGNRDIIISNGFPKDLSDRDFLSFRLSASSVASKADIIETMPVVKIADYAFKNNGDLSFSDVTQQWGMNRPSFSNGAAYADLDNDGDLDCVINNINEPAFIYKNNLRETKADSSHWFQLEFLGNEKNRMGLGTMVDIYFDKGKKIVYEHTVYRGYLSSVSAIAHFGLGKVASIDSVRIIWPDRHMQLIRNPKTDQRLKIIQSDAIDIYSGDQLTPVSKQLFVDVSAATGLVYRNEETDFVDFNIQKLLPHKLSQYGPSLSAGDIDGNGTVDIFTGGAKGRSGKFFLQDKNGKFTVRDLLPATTSKPEEDMGSLLFDADNDGDPDLYIVSGAVESDAGSDDYKDRFYVNKGKGKFDQDTAALPAIVISGSAVKGADFDNDGDIDIIRTGRVDPGFYPRPVTTTVLRNDSKNGLIRFTDITSETAPFLKNIGMVCDALCTDFDNDGWIDIILCGEWMAPVFMKNVNGHFSDVSASAGLTDMVGWWNSIVSGDFDNDGDMDYVMGNSGENTLYKADKKHPVGIYANDFNSDGSYDAIPTIFLSDSIGNRKEYPPFGRDDMIRQMITMRKKFIRYKDYAGATIDEVLSAAEKKNALVYKATNLRSCYIENMGDAKFKMHELPTEAQFAPVFGMISQDLDSDGNLDLVLNGNDFGVELSVGKCDALNGLVLKGNGRGGFKSLSISQSGMFIPGNGKALIAFPGPDNSCRIMASQNRSTMKVFTENNSYRIIPVNDVDSYALLHLKDKRIRKQEFYYGTSFLSQSFRFLAVGNNVDIVEIIDTKNRKRQIRF